MKRSILWCVATMYSGLIVRRKQGLGKPALITLNYPSDAKFIAKEGEDAQA